VIMPSKYLREDETLIGISAILLSVIEKNGNLSAIWESVKKLDAIGNFERFILALDLLYMLDLIKVRNNEIVRVNNDS